MAMTEIYVDPSIAADSGAGTVGDPYGDLEYAIEQSTFDTTNGTRVNIKAGTDEVLAAELGTALADTSVSIAWAPNASAHLTFQGYTTAAGDGGVGGISGGGTVGVLVDANLDYTSFVDLHLHNCGANRILLLDNDCSVIRCELDNTSDDAIVVGNISLVYGCYIHNIGDIGVTTATASVIAFNYFENGVDPFRIVMNAVDTCVYRNIIDISGVSDGIWCNGGSAINNSIYSAAGSGTGLSIISGDASTVVNNNLIEGFSASGGFGIEFNGATACVHVYEGNAVYDCETEFEADSGAVFIVDTSGNETLSASPFTDAANGDFSPVDTGSVKEGSLPQIIGGGLV